MSTEDSDTDTPAEPSDFDALEDADVTLYENDHGLHIADDESTGVSSQGPTAEDALRNLAAAVRSYREATDDDPGDDWL